MSLSLWFNPHQCRHCDLIDCLMSVASDFGKSFLSLVTSASTGTRWRPCDMHRCLCVSLMIGSGVLDEQTYAGKSTQTRRINPPWTVPQTAPTFLSWSPPRHLAGSVLCSRVGRASKAEGPPASPGILPYRNLCRCWAAPAFEQTHAFTSLHYWVTHLTKSACGWACTPAFEQTHAFTSLHYRVTHLTKSACGGAWFFSPTNFTFSLQKLLFRRIPKMNR